MWVQGVYGPAHPSGAMATAFGGMFLGKNVLTIRHLAPGKFQASQSLHPFFPLYPKKTLTTDQPTNNQTKPINNQTNQHRNTPSIHRNNLLAYFCIVEKSAFWHFLACYLGASGY